MSDTAEKCINALKCATTDTEKFAALLLITKVVKAQDCDRETRRRIFDAVGFTFVNRLLNTVEVPEGCPRYIYKAIALTLLSCFCTDYEVACNPLMLDKLSDFADIINDCGVSFDEEMMVADALQCIACVAGVEGGRKAIIERGVLPKLCKTVENGKYGQDQASAIVLNLLAKAEGSCWDNKIESFNELLTKFAIEFMLEKSEKKFEMCQKLVVIMNTCPTGVVETSDKLSWYHDIHRGLSDILFSKGALPHIEHTLKLASVMIEKLGVQWALRGDPERGKKFFQLYINLACVEIRMIMEERSLDQVAEDSQLLTACFSSLEITVNALVTSESILPLDHNEKQQLYLVITSAMSAVVTFLSTVSSESLPVLTDELDETRRQLLHASFRVTGAWLAEETSALRDDVCDLLPFLLKTASDNFSKLAEGKEQVDISRFLIPGLCHLSAEDRPREIILGIDFHRTLFEYLKYHWSLWLKQEGSKESESTIVTICGVFMNITVLEVERVPKDSLFHDLLHFTLKALPFLAYKIDHLPLIGNFSVLGLLLLKHYAGKIRSCETFVYRYLSSCIKFLWDAHNVEDSRDLNSMVIAREYRKVWDQVKELWFLGMQALSTVLPQMPWIAQFIVESGWTGVIVDSLLKIREGAVDASTKSAYEHVLCCLVLCGGDVGETLKKQGALQVSTLHKMKELESLLSPSQLAVK